MYICAYWTVLVSIPEDKDMKLCKCSLELAGLRLSYESCHTTDAACRSICLIADGSKQHG